jgi:Vitamin K-dependent gamma-carboxylase
MADAYGLLGRQLPVLIERAVPRVLGAFAIVFSAFLLPSQQPFDNLVSWGVYFALWLCASFALLFSSRLTRVAAGGLAVLAFVGVFWPQASSGEPYTIMVWLGLIVASTVGRPDERALLLRVCATAVYVFAALTKLNPQFLNGEQLLWLVDTRPQLQSLRPLVESSWGPLWAWGVIAAEISLPGLLWWSKTRQHAAVGGALFHCCLVVTGTIGGLVGLALLVTLNGLLVLCYVGFLAVPEGTRSWGLVPWRIGMLGPESS